MRVSGRIVALVIVALTGVVFLSAASAETLRAFGTVTVAEISAGNLAGYGFQCENPDKARVLMTKLGRDMEQSATVKAMWQTVKVGGADANVLVRPGLGSFLPAVVGSQVLAFTTPTTEGLEAAFAPAAAKLAGARFWDASFRYPVYLDKFDHFGIGSWYPQYWGDDNTKGKPNSVDDHFAYAKQMGLTLQPNGGGHLLANLLPKLREYDRPLPLRAVARMVVGAGPDVPGGPHPGGLAVHRHAELLWAGQRGWEEAANAAQLRLPADGQGAR